ncbi:xanthine dehydrogenase accessory protein XdhC [Paraglaciecola aquimarina]|uniref:Xanthine dehydrogenase accessory protein XdhC n=1 Tax=Paraglaciecola aquimarina TaxID=1235557 RepID=A0ABU3SYH6_9ALTE|nr:xanthine dehydrogenase accessory protein XdhC [Paraglaciecola aquimarina]MDU0355051.1 xanthine dehydrogenase accessory protein XdhC [Paraglaciecola aquimarina]
MLNQSTTGFHQLSWAQAAAHLDSQQIDYVIVTVIKTLGSVPRASGTKMLVSLTDIYDTIGGGHLEYKAIKKARELLGQTNSEPFIEQFKLGANLGQCCGGQATVLFEVMHSHSLKLDVYGAGHVAQALMPIIQHLPVQIRWIDSRKEVFPAKVDPRITVVVDEDPTEQAKLADANTASLILTHNHQLDFALVQTILTRNDALWLGVIGSETKAKRFAYKLSHRDFSPEQIKQMICPVGLPQIQGKLPMEVAVSIAGQLISLYQSWSKQQKSDHNPVEKAELSATTPNMETTE